MFDEPTTALDVTTQIEVLRAFKTAMRERHVTAVYVSHDLAVVAQMADRIVVLSKGVIRETGTTAQVLDTPRRFVHADVDGGRPPGGGRITQPRPSHASRCWQCAASSQVTAESAQRACHGARC